MLFLFFNPQLSIIPLLVAIEGSGGVVQNNCNKEFCWITHHRFVRRLKEYGKRSAEIGEKKLRLIQLWCKTTNLR